MFEAMQFCFLHFILLFDIIYYVSSVKTSFSEKMHGHIFFGITHMYHSLQCLSQQAKAKGIELTHACHLSIRSIDSLEVEHYYVFFSFSICSG